MITQLIFQMPKTVKSNDNKREKTPVPYPEADRNAMPKPPSDQ